MNLCSLFRRPFLSFLLRFFFSFPSIHSVGSSQVSQPASQRFHAKQTHNVKTDLFIFHFANARNAAHREHISNLRFEMENYSGNYQFGKFN